MDYDKTSVPDTYDSGREISAAAKYQQLEFFIENLQIEDVAEIIDLGCGTGRFSEALADAFEARVVGIDPSQKMLTLARSKSTRSNISFKLAHGEVVPLADNSADMVFMSMVLHHLTSLENTASECGRILRGGGNVCVRNTVSDEISSYPYLDYFPSINSIIQKQLLSRKQLNDVLEAAGFKMVAHQTVWSEISSDWRSFAEKIKLKADSFVAQLDESEFKSGLSALRTKAEGEDSNEKVGLNVDSFIFQKL